MTRWYFNIYMNTLGRNIEMYIDADDSQTAIDTVHLFTGRSYFWEFVASNILYTKV